MGHCQLTPGLMKRAPLSLSTELNTLGSSLTISQGSPLITHTTVCNYTLFLFWEGTHYKLYGGRGCLFQLTTISLELSTIPGL